MERHHDPRSCGLQQKLDDLEARRAALEGELEAAPPPAPRLHPNLAELYRRRVSELRAALADPLIRQEAVELLRGLVEAVTITPTDTGPRIELTGDIVRMLALPAGSAVPGLDACSAKVVAGAGFEPATFRL